MGSITVSNRPVGLDPVEPDFDLFKVKVNSNYNIILHYVYDPDNRFDTEYAFLKDPSLDSNTLVVFWHPVEMGTWRRDLVAKFNSALANKPFKSIYLTGCTSRLDLNKHYNMQFDCRFFPVFDIRASNLWNNTPAEINVDKTKKFSCLASKDVDHRRFLFANLFNANRLNSLLDEGYVSYKCTNWDYGHDKNKFNFSEGQGFTPEQLSRIQGDNQSVMGVVPRHIDDFNVASKLPRSTFLDSYINIVGETDFVNVPYSHRRSFVTEKTFNAIANNQMFIVVGHAYSLQVLKDLGYQTFEDVIDERYDLIEHNGTRLLTVIDTIIKFLSRPIEDIMADYIKVQDRIQANRDLLFSQNLDQRLQAVIDSL